MVAAFLLAHAAAVSVDLVFGPTAAAHLRERWERKGNTSEAVADSYHGETETGVCTGRVCVHIESTFTNVQKRSISGKFYQTYHTYSGESVCDIENVNINACACA